MRFRVTIPDRPEGRQTPRQVLRRWVLVGAVVGMVLAGFTAVLVAGFAMIAGGTLGAMAGAVIGILHAAVKLVTGGRGGG